MPARDDATAGDDVHLRPAMAADLEVVVRIWHEGWVDAHTGHVPEAQLPYRRREHFVTLAGQRVAGMWVAERHGATAGFIVVKGDEVEQLYVDRAHRGSGVAAALLHTGEAEVRRAGHSCAWLAVVAGNRRARAFYARLGWRDAGPMSYLAQTADGPLPVPTHRYERDLLA